MVLTYYLEKNWAIEVSQEGNAEVLLRPRKGLHAAGADSFLGEAEPGAQGWRFPGDLENTLRTWPGR